MPQHTEAERRKVRNQIRLPDREPLDFRLPRPGKTRPREIPTSGGGIREFGRDLFRNAFVQNDFTESIDRNVFPNLSREVGEVERRVAAANTRPAGTELTAERIGSQAGDTLKEIGRGAITEPIALAQDIARPLDPLVRGVGGFFGLIDPDRPPDVAGGSKEDGTEVVGPPGTPPVPQEAFGPTDADLGRNAPPPPAPTLANAGREAVAAPPQANPAGQFEGGVPEGFINVIRGTDSTFQRVDEEGRVADRNQAFRAVPGQTLDQSENIARRRDPAFNVLTEQDLDRTRVNNQTLQAEAQRQNAQAGAMFDAIGPDGTVQIFTVGADGQIQGTGLSPDTIVNGGDDYEIETVEIPTEFPGQTTKRSVLKAPDGSIVDITEQLRQEIGEREFDKLQTQNPDASIEELIEQAEALSGGGALSRLRAEHGL